MRLQNQRTLSFVVVGDNFAVGADICMSPSAPVSCNCRRRCPVPTPWGLRKQPSATATRFSDKTALGAVAATFDWQIATHRGRWQDPESAVDSTGAFVSAIAHLIAPEFMADGTAWPLASGWQREIAFFDMFFALFLINELRTRPIEYLDSLITATGVLSFFSRDQSFCFGEHRTLGLCPHRWMHRQCGGRHRQSLSGGAQVPSVQTPKKWSRLANRL